MCGFLLSVRSIGTGAHIGPDARNGDNHGVLGSPRVGAISDREDLDDAIQSTEVGNVAGDERQAVRARGSGNEKIYCARSACLVPRGDDTRVDPPVRARSLAVKGEGVERRFRSLQAVLAPRPFDRVRRRVGTCREFAHRDRADRNLKRQSIGIDGFEVDDYGRIEKTASEPGLRHEVLGFGSRGGRDRCGTWRSRSGERRGTWQRPCRRL